MFWVNSVFEEIETKSELKVFVKTKFCMKKFQFVNQNLWIKEKNESFGTKWWTFDLHVVSCDDFHAKLLALQYSCWLWILSTPSPILQVYESGKHKVTKSYVKIWKRKFWIRYANKGIFLKKNFRFDLQWFVKIQQNSTPEPLL